MQLAKKYWRTKRFLFLANIIYTALLLYAVIFSRASIVLRNMSIGLSGEPAVYIAIYLLWLGVFFFVMTFPLRYYEGFALEHKFNLSPQPFKRWLKRFLKKSALSGIITLLLVEGAYAFLRSAPGNWWLFAAGAWVLFTVIFSKIAPIVILPMFYRCYPLEDEELKNRLMAMAEKTGARVRGAFKINMSKETKKANAALIGIGNTRRIIIGDTLLDNFTHDEIEVVLAHELGHHKKFHLGKLLAFGTLTTFTGLYAANLFMIKYLRYFGFADISDIGAFPLLYLILLAFSVFAMPLQSSFSRYLESRADVFALKATGKPDAFISTMTKLAERNLSDTSPGKFIEVVMYNHPPVAKRIKMANRFKQSAYGKS